MTLYVTAVHTFVAEHADELEFQAGDKIEVLERDEAFGDGWWKVRGLCRSRYLARLVLASEQNADAPPGP